MEQPASHPDADFIFRIIEALGDATDTDPLELELPLQTVVDVDALAQLVESDAMGTVRFTYKGYTVGVEDDETVSVSDATDGQ